MSDILCISTTDWDEIWGSRQQLMQIFAQAGHRILFVERQVGPEHLLRNPEMRRRKLQAWRPTHPIAVQNNLWRWQPPVMPPGRYYADYLNQLGQNRLAAQLRSVLAELGFNKPVLWLYPPHSAPLLGQLKESLSVYHCIERFAGNQTGRKRQVMLAQEEKLLRQVDQVFTHAEGLRQLYAPLTRRPIVLTPSAADVAHYQSTDQIHPLMQAVPEPRLAVIGTLDERIDQALLTEIARQRPGWNLALIGRIRPPAARFSELFALPNVHHLGKQPFSALPALLNGASVALIPYVFTEMTSFISPLKAYEYLAVGKAIVSVALPEVRNLATWVKIVETNADSQQFSQAFIAAIEEALAQDTQEQQFQRRQAAWQHTWQARARLMLETLAQIEK